MKSASIESFQRERGGVVIVIEFGAGALGDYELDHLGDVLSSYLSLVGFDSVVGPKSVRTHMTDEELELELDDFEVVLQRDSRLDNTPGPQKENAGDE